MRVGLSVHAPYSCHPDLFRAAVDWCEAEGIPLGIHIAESPAEVLYLRDASGPFREINARLRPGVPEDPAPGLSPIGYLEALDVLRVRPLLFHGVEVDEADLLVLRRRDCAVFTVRAPTSACCATACHLNAILRTASRSRWAPTRWRRRPH